MAIKGSYISPKKIELATIHCIFHLDVSDLNEFVYFLLKQIAILSVSLSACECRGDVWWSIVRRVRGSLGILRAADLGAGAAMNRSW